MARRFRFSLQPVLEHRRRLEEERLREVAIIEQERVRTEDKLRGINARLVQSRADLRERFSPAPGATVRGGIGAVRLDSSSALRLTVEAQQAAIELAGVMRRLERARAALLEAATARKGVERLRERRLEEWKHELSRRENAELDEMATIGASRAAAPGGFEQ
jgi:flagellar export protein FliJ